MNEKRISKLCWKDSFNVNVELIDEHHKKFFDVINELIDVVNNEECNTEIPGIFHKLGFYIENYIVDEEMFFQNNNYPNFSKHKESHNTFTQKIIEFQERYFRKEDQICESLLNYLIDWFEKHMLEYDKESVAFLSGK